MSTEADFYLLPLKIDSCQVECLRVPDRNFTVMLQFATMMVQHCSDTTCRDIDR